MGRTRYTAAPDVTVAHRGGAGCRPENSWAAFRWSYALGVRWFETDVRASRDGVPVLHHDRSLRRLFGLEADVRDLTWDELRGLRTPGGERLLRPSDVLEAMPDARLAVDVKEARVVPGLLAELRRVDAVDRVCVAGASDAVLAGVARAEPAVERALGWQSLVRLLTRVHLGLPVGRLPDGAGWLHVPDRVPDRFGGRVVCTAQVVECAHERGLRVLAWTVDDPERMRALLDLGVDGVITDRPDLLREALVARSAAAGRAGGPVAPPTLPVCPPASPTSDVLPGPGPTW
ncbi:glycerophosphodiester phosphodiesterase family protein [Aquipuribacter nitratireducens]|uniref:Glycerophosphodiester phosphodiesterase family protein n=1 Tax=Aquipuribacter nitratireducens TaxID=650104 RepID=A0ABW0GRU3_9MICO